MMYGTIAKMRAKADSEEAFMRVVEEIERATVPGQVAVYVYQMDADSLEFFMVVMFESREAYLANANTPEQHDRFMQLMTVLDGEPEWHDGTIVFENT